MSLPFRYNARNLTARFATTAMTVSGIALVVFVFVASLMLDAGLKETLAGTGSSDNIIVLRSGSRNEVQSSLAREDIAVLATDPAFALDADGRPFFSADSVVLISLKKRSDGNPSNITMRGVSLQALSGAAAPRSVSASGATAAAAQSVRREVTLVDGRFPFSGAREVVVGASIHKKFAQTDSGDSIRLVGADWKVVGRFDAGTSAFNSEIWGDVDTLMPAFKREQFSSLVARLADPSQFAAVKQRLEADARLNVSVMTERDFYEEQSQALGMFIKIIGTSVSVIFSIGAVVGALITMYSAVAARRREIGILRAIGFPRGSIFWSFLRECLFLSLLGGVVGVAFASALVSVGVSTTNFQTFSEVAFGFRMTWTVALAGLVFSLLMGLFGGCLPAFHAGRMKLFDALRA